MLSSPYSVTVPSGGWVPVQVAVTNSGQAALEGQVVVTSPVQMAAAATVGSCFYNGTATTCPGGGWVSYGSQLFMPFNMTGGSVPTKPVVDRLALDLAPGTTKHMLVYVLAQSGQPAISAQVLSRSGSVLARGKLDLPLAPGTGGPAVLVLSDDPSASSLPVAMPSMLARPQVQVLTPAELPGSPAALGMFSAVVIDQAGTTVLTRAQGQALLGYVENGGMLLVAGGLGWQNTVAGLPPGLLPARVVGSVALHLSALARLLGVPPLTSQAQVSTLSLRRGAEATLSEGARPLAVQEALGEGQVVLCAVDPAAPPLAAWAGTAPLLARLLAPAFQDDYYGQGPAFAAAGPNGSVTVPGSLLGKFGSTGSPGFTDPDRAGAAFAAYMEQIPGASLPSVHFLGLLLLGYVVVAGPLCFLVLARLHRRHLAWVVVPALAVAAALVAWGSGAGMDRAPLLDQLRVDQLVPGSPQAEVLSLGAVYLPRGGSHRVTLGGGGLVTAWGAMGGGQLTIGPGEAPGDDQLKVSGSNNSLGGWAAVQDVRINGMVGVSAHFAGSTVEGTVTNRLPVQLTSAYLVSLAGFKSLGSLVPGAKASFSISAQALSGAPGYMLPMFAGNGSGPAGSAGARHQALVQGLYSLATTYSAEHGGAPVLVAVAGGQDGGQGGAGLGGPGAEGQLNVLAVPLEPVHRLTGGGLWPVLVGSAGVVDENAGGFNGGSSMSLSAGSWLDFHYTLPGGPAPARSGLRVDLGSASANGLTTGLARGGPPPSPVQARDVVLSAFNYQTGQWDKLSVRAYQGSLVADLPAPAHFVGPGGPAPAHFVGPGGAVELRLEAVRALQIYGANPTLRALP